MWSRLASRILLSLGAFPAASPEELYAGVRAISWEEHLSADDTLAVMAVSTDSAITHTRFAAQKTKDAVVDRFRDLFGRRPSVRTDRPDVVINVAIRRNVANVSIDLSGESLHRRGYRRPGAQTEAPLKETLAAAVLLRADWLAVAAEGGAFVDPMCGTGTLPIEAALMAGDAAPGLLRDYFGFLGWSGHDPDMWNELLAEARERREEGLKALPPIFGSDADAGAIEAARDALGRAGLACSVTLQRADLYDLVRPAGAERGLVATNPPYGVRMRAAPDLKELYATLGRRLLADFMEWDAAVLTSEPELARAIGLRATRWYDLYNGAIPVRLYTFEVRSDRVKAPVTPAPPAPAGTSMSAKHFADRLRKDIRHLGKWARRTGVTCWRVYDADLPDYSVAIDRYESTRGDVWAHVSEYAAPPEIDPERAEARMRDVEAIVPSTFGIPLERLVLKERRRQRGSSQYERLAEHGEVVEVAEAGLLFEVNLTGYVDTGLFLDHRDTRALVREMAEGARFCNLFAYTGCVSAYAAAGGAASTTTVDMSATYLDWARRNMARNGFAEGDEHRFLRADVLGWLKEAAPHAAFDLVFLDPPTFSNSTRMGDRTFDVQRDHVDLIRSAVRLLAPGGTLLFSTNARRFRMDTESLRGLETTDITKSTIPPDFARDVRVHSCWRIQARD